MPLLPSNWQSPYCCCELLAFSTAITLFNCELFAGVAFSSKDCSWQRCDPNAGIQMLKAWWTTNASAAWLQLTTCCDSRLAFQRATCFACHTSQLEGFDVLVYDLHGFGVGLMESFVPVIISCFLSQKYPGICFSWILCCGQ